MNSEKWEQYYNRGSRIGVKSEASPFKHDADLNEVTQRN